MKAVGKYFCLIWECWKDANSLALRGMPRSVREYIASLSRGYLRSLEYRCNLLERILTGTFMNPSLVGETARVGTSDHTP